MQHLSAAKSGSSRNKKILRQKIFTIFFVTAARGVISLRRASNKALCTIIYTDLGKGKAPPHAQQGQALRVFT